MAEAAELSFGCVDRRLAIIHPGSTVSELAVVGAPGEWRDRVSRFPACIGDGVIVREFAVIHAGVERHTFIGADTVVCSGAYVAHDVRIGEGCDIAPGARILGLCSIGDRVKVGAGAVLRPRVRVGDGARIGAGAVVTKDVPAGETWAGNPARCLHAWRGGAA